MSLVISLLFVTYSLVSVGACNTKALSGFIVNHEEDQVKLYCKQEGEQCKFDRNCCGLLECKMSADNNINSFCQFRFVPEDYVIGSNKGLEWEDYQELQSEETEKRDSETSLKALEEKNLVVWSKIVELVNLRKEMDKIELKNLKEEHEAKEIKRLREIKELLEKKDQVELKRMQFLNELNQLEELERQEVNNTLVKQQAVSDLYRDMLEDIMKKEQQQKP